MDLKRTFLLLMFITGLVVAAWSYVEFANFIQDSQFAIPNQDLDPVVAKDLLDMKNHNLFPNLPSGIYKVEIETTDKSEQIEKIAASYRKFFQVTNGGKSILKVSLIHQDSNLLVLMSLEDRKTKNRYWEMGRTLSLNPR